MAGAPTHWRKITWHRASASVAKVALSCNNKRFLVTTASTFRLSLTSSTIGVGTHSPAAAGCCVAVSCVTAESAPASCRKGNFHGRGVSSHSASFTHRVSPRRLVHQPTFTKFLCCRNVRKSQTSSNTRNTRIVSRIHNCSRSNSSRGNSSTRNSSSHTSSDIAQRSSACSSNPGRTDTTSDSRNRAYDGSNQWSRSSFGGGSGCKSGSSSNSSFDKKISNSSNSRLLSCGAWSSSRCEMNMLRWRRDTNTVLLGEGKSILHLFALSRYYSMSSFFSFVINTAALISNRYFSSARLRGCSSLLLLESPKCWAADASQRECCSYPLPPSGDNHSSRKGSTAVSTSPAGGLLQAHVRGDDRDNSSSEGGSSTAWGKAAAALTTAAAAAAIARGGPDRGEVREGHHGQSIILCNTWSSFLSCASSPLFSSPSAGFLQPVSAISRSPPASRVSHLLSNLSDSSSCVSSPSSVVRGVVSLGRSALVRCCGIVGYVGDKEAQPLLLGGLEILQNRGYDSCGISSVPAEGGTLITTKYASRGSTCDSLEILKKEAQNPHAGNRVGIGHTRWATHGSKTDANAHPHHDWRDRVSVVHNGTIDNFSALKQALLRRGCKFRSETDTEVIANLIGWHLDNGAGFEDAVKNAVGEIQGTWGLCILHKDYPDRLILARNGSPLLVGASSGQVFVASEPAALAQHTNQYLMLKDGEIAVITAEGIGQLEATRPMHFIGTEDKIELSPAPFPHWTVKEIYEQPQALARAMNYGGRIAPYRSAVKLGGLDQSREPLLAIKNLLICGCGTSLYAGLYGELLMQWLGCLHQVRAIDASELELHAFPKEDAGILLLSQSGETLDTVRACQLAEIHGIKKFSIVNQVGSLLARLTDCGVYVNAGREVAVASTKAFSCQVTVLSLIAAWFFQNKSEHPASQQHSDRCAALMDAIQRLPVYAGMTLNCRDACASVAAKLADAKTIFVLGKGFGYPVALEGALKIKEVGCIHAEGFAAGALKHGPFALIDETERTPVIMLLLGDHHAAYMLNAAQQVKARGAHLVCVTDVPEAVKGIADDVLVVPTNGPLTALLACIPLQLLAYEFAVIKGINPDKPRGLAKTVTVF